MDEHEHKIVQYVDDATICDLASIQRVASLSQQFSSALLKGKEDKGYMAGST